MFHRLQSFVLPTSFPSEEQKIGRSKQHEKKKKDAEWVHSNSNTIYIEVKKKNIEYAC